MEVARLLGAKDMPVDKNIIDLYRIGLGMVGEKDCMHILLYTYPTVFKNLKIWMKEKNIRLIGKWKSLYRVFNWMRLGWAEAGNALK